MNSIDEKMGYTTKKSLKVIDNFQKKNEKSRSSMKSLSKSSRILNDKENIENNQEEKFQQILDQRRAAARKILSP